jgi:uncharacterized membrane protein YjgN (DUF898 family)
MTQFNNPAYPPVVAHPQPAPQPPPEPPRDVPFRFTGTADEYFRIWIVNVALSVLTLGAYSAWAKVRTRQYFYRNTWLEDSSFEYLANPIRILKGRVLIAVVLGALFAVQHYSVALYAVLAFGLFFATPWVVVKALAFNARNSAFRNVRFTFQGSTGEAFGVYALAVMVYIFTFGMGYPYAKWRLSQFYVGKHLYGDEAFSWDTQPGAYFKVFLVSMAITVGIVVMTVAVFAGGAVVFDQFDTAADPASSLPKMAPMIMLGVMYLLFVLPFAYNRAYLTNAMYGGVTIGSHRLVSELEFLPLLKIYVTNFLAIVFSLGLLTPWAKVRLARYRAESMKLLSIGPLQARRYELARGAGALGDAAVDLGDFDLDLGV